MTSWVKVTFRTIVVLSSIAAAAVRIHAVHAAGPASPSPTPAVDQYLITWNATMKGSFRQDDRDGYQYCEFSMSSTTTGTAIVKFKYEGNPPQLKRESRIVSGFVTEERDEKDHVIDKFCGDWLQAHDHYSYQPIQPIVGMDWWMPDAPRKQPDGSWVILYPFSGRAAFAPKQPAYYVHLRETTKCYAPCLEEGPANIGCVKWGASELHPDSRKFEPMKADSPNVVGVTYAFDSHWDDVKSTDPSFFSKEVETDVDAPGTCPGAPRKGIKVKWAFTIRRLGKCLVGDSIPVNDDPVNPDINDEDIEMGVEHGSASIDPDNGVAALNLRVTCDTVPIKNAKVEVKVEVQKNTGGHTHSAADRPRGRLKWNGLETRLTDAKPSIKVKTDDDGRAHLTFKPGKAITCGGQPTRTDSAGQCDRFGIAGIYRITATCDPVRFPGRKAEVAVEAKVDGLSHLDADPNYVNDVGAASHTSGDNATTATKQRLHPFASAFRDVQVKHNQELVACGGPPGPAPEAFTKPAQLQQWPIFPLWVIDVSLPFGGQYDIGPPEGSFWSTPHQTHPRGDGVDLSVHNRILSGKATAQNMDKRPWPADGFNVPVCDGYKIAPQGWLMMKMYELGGGLDVETGSIYGHWDKSDFNAPSQPWHLHVNQ